MHVHQAPLVWPEPLLPKPALSADAPFVLDDVDPKKERSPSEGRRQRATIPPPPTDADAETAPALVPAYAGKLDVMA